MTVDFISLSIIFIIAALSPLLAQLIPSKLVPESVFLLIAGAVLGFNCLDIIFVDSIVDFLSDLGLAFLFLLAGMELEPKSLLGREGRRGIVTWAASLVIALALVTFVPWFQSVGLDGMAVGIALTTTAFGTLVPIMKERGLAGTKIGDSITAYGAWGELGPVLAISLLLSTRSSIQTVLVLALMAAFAVVLAIVPAKARQAGSRIYGFLTGRADATYQTMTRVTVLILVLLLAFSAIFDLDVVLGAFAAGFVMRYVIPENSHTLKLKLEGMAYGFFIPIFFIVSGTEINLAAVGEHPILLILFIIALLVVRGVPIFISLLTDRHCELSIRRRWTVAIYCTTALPLIVAVTTIATNAGTMSQDTASILVAAGAISVFLMPLLAAITYRIADAEPVVAAQEIAKDPKKTREVLHEHKLIKRKNAFAAKLGDVKRHIAGEELAGKTPPKQEIKKKDKLERSLEEAEAALAKAREGAK